MGLTMEKWGPPSRDVPVFAFTPAAGLGGRHRPHCPPTLLLPCWRAAFADSCAGRCEDGFDARRKCQCDTLCVYYQSCCSDYSTVCKAKGTGSAAALPAGAGAAGLAVGA